MPKSRRSSSSRSRKKSTKPFKLGIDYDALKKYLAVSLKRSDLDPALDTLQDLAGEHDDIAGEHGGIDYGPAISAVHDLATWAFGIAERDVRGWPDAERRVSNARRFVLARIRGYRARRVPFEDVIFTAGLLVRIFDNDLALGLSEMVAILDMLGLPTDVVPIVPRNASSASATRPAPTPRSPIAPMAARRPRPLTAVAAPAQLTRCHECGHVHAPLWPHLRNAA